MNEYGVRLQQLSDEFEIESKLPLGDKVILLENFVTNSKVKIGQMKLQLASQDKVSSQKVRGREQSNANRAEKVPMSSIRPKKAKKILLKSSSKQLTEKRPRSSEKAFSTPKFKTEQRFSPFQAQVQSPLLRSTASSQLRNSKKLDCLKKQEMA